MNIFERMWVPTDLGRHPELRERFTVPERWAWVMGVLAIAADAPIRGTFVVEAEPANAADIAIAASVPLDVAESTLGKCRWFGMLVRDDELDCEAVRDFREFNDDARRDPANAERQRLARERLRRQW